MTLCRSRVGALSGTSTTNSPRGPWWPTPHTRRSLGWAGRPRCGWGAVHVRAAAQLRSHHRLSASTVPSGSGVVYRDLAIMTASWVRARKPRHDHQTHLDLQPGCRCRVGVLDWLPQGALPRGCDRPVGPSGPGPMRSFWRPVCNARSPPASPTVARAGSALLGFRHEDVGRFRLRLSAFAQARLDRDLGTLHFIASKQNVVFLGPVVIEGSGSEWLCLRCSGRCCD